MDGVRGDTVHTLRSMQRLLPCWRAELEDGKMPITSTLDPQYQDGSNFDRPRQLTLKTSDHGRQESYVDGSVVPNEARRQPMEETACHALLHGIYQAKTAME